MSGNGTYKDTLNLPATEFPMRANLARREPEMLAAWDAENIYGQIQAARADAPTFLLHDGPPYANGPIHYGHILNKILKDIIVKYKTMAGFRAPFVPGWDTHGLPIELAVDRQLGASKRDMSQAQVRAACREYALRYVDIQREQFRRLGIFGTWDRPYLTLDPGYEAAIVRALAAFARGGYLYRGNKPVYWCPRDRTALAEAEIEYADHTSPSIYVRLPLTDDFDPGVLSPKLAGEKLALTIWTTTPWTLPANLAVVLKDDIDYVALRSPRPRDDGEYLLVARELVPQLCAAMGADPEAARLEAIPKQALLALEGARYQHPFMGPPRADNDYRVWFADYVTLEQGTGLVHTAPGHGADDYRTGVAHGLAPYSPVDGAGRFTDDVPHWAGLETSEANPEIAEYLHEQGYLLNQPGETVRHSYAHCWRCKGPTLFRATPQWFLSIDHNALRERALSEIDLTEWVPPWGKSRIHGMIENRPDWCLSRQRTWGVPIPALYCKACGTEHAEAETMERVADVFAEHGADIWYQKPIAEILPDVRCTGCGAGDFEAENDIVDVWFESGCSWFAVCAPRPDLGDVDLYLEGSDQHRGWFHSSLLVGIGVSGKAPYQTVITHGFVLDENGVPYSKSALEKARAAGKKTSYLPPEQVIEKYGAEMFRLWVASTEFRNDIPYSQKLLDGLSDWYRKFRNTARFALGNLSDFDPDRYTLENTRLTELDHHALARLGDVIARVRAAYDAYELHAVHRALVDYVAVDLSALYLDVIKDRLYSDAPDAPSRRAAQLVLYNVVRALATLSAPIMSFTAEDVWKHLPRRADDPASVHLVTLPEGKRLTEDDPLARRWAILLGYREQVTRELEAFRARKNKSVDARVTITPRAADRELLTPLLADLAELFIVSDVVLTDNDATTDDGPVVAISKHPGARCARCWKWFDTMSPNPELCPRCHDAVAAAR